MLEGIAAVQARIAEIQSHFSGPAPLARAKAPAASPAAGPAASPTFASALTKATGIADATGLTPADRKRPGEFGAMRVPDELRRYGNGRIPPDALAPIGVGNHRLARDAASAFTRMHSDASTAGVNIGVADSYRSFDAQVDLARRKGLYSSGGLAAAPGTSNHGWGLAVDVDVDGRGQAWLRENGWRYGFVEDTPREPWHWGYRPSS
jgi:zinc D-Ala-D-Ala carboxypeptidase